MSSDRTKNFYTIIIGQATSTPQQDSEDKILHRIGKQQYAKGYR